MKGYGLLSLIAVNLAVLLGLAVAYPHLMVGPGPWSVHMRSSTPSASPVMRRGVAPPLTDASPATQSPTSAFV